MILCDLPYQLTARNKWDTKIPIEPLWAQFERVIRGNGAIVLFSQQPFTSELVMSNKKLFKYEWVYEKANAAGFLNSHHAPLKAHENILVFSKGAASPVKDANRAMPYYPQFTYSTPYVATSGKRSMNYQQQADIVRTNSDGRRYPRDILKFTQEKGLHPTQKPVPLCEYLIKTYTQPGEVVLDVCMGSGTTCVAAKQCGRKYIGFEKEPKYFETAKKRIEGSGVQECIISTQVTQ